MTSILVQWYSPNAEYYLNDFTDFNSVGCQFEFTKSLTVCFVQKSFEMLYKAKSREKQVLALLLMYEYQMKRKSMRVCGDSLRRMFYLCILILQLSIGFEYSKFMIISENNSL